MVLWRMTHADPAFGICRVQRSPLCTVIGGDSGGAPDAIWDGESGYVVPGRSVAAVADRAFAGEHGGAGGERDVRGLRADQNLDQVT